METTQVIIFGEDRDTVIEATSGIRTLAEKKGVEYRGPHPLPQIDLREKEVTLDDDVELLGEAPTGLTKTGISYYTGSSSIIGGACVRDCK